MLSCTRSADEVFGSSNPFAKRNVSRPSKPASSLTRPSRCVSTKQPTLRAPARTCVQSGSAKSASIRTTSTRLSGCVSLLLLRISPQSDNFHSTVSRYNAHRPVSRSQGVPSTRSRKRPTSALRRPAPADPAQHPQLPLPHPPADTTARDYTSVHPRPHALDPPGLHGPERARRERH